VAGFCEHGNDPRVHNTRDLNDFEFLIEFLSVAVAGVKTKCLFRLKI
jgi:hypothetical protein